MAGEDEKINT